VAATKYSLDGKRVLVTGASAGIGAAVARSFAEAGATVGICARRHVRDLRLDEVNDVMTLNYLSPVHLMLALLPNMLARGEGRIVNVSSIAARLSAPREASYAATKAALTAFTECMAVDLAGTGVSVHLVFPGVIDTDLFHLPDNEESLSDLEALPASAMAEAMKKQVETGEFELYFPAWFADIAKAKAADVPGFLAGTTEWVRQREAQLGAAG
jgi:short-subunit dehydrogenase